MKHLPALVVGALMVLAGFVSFNSASAAAKHDPVFLISQWTLLLGGFLVEACALLSRTRPRNAGFGVVLASMAVLMSGATALPFQPLPVALPGTVLGAVGLAAGVYLMWGTRAGDK